MGWFGWGASGNGGAYEKSPVVMQFEQQIEMMDIVFQKTVKQCSTKCIPTTYKDGELNKGESVCINRCISKYFQVLELVSTQLAEIGMQNQQAASGSPLPKL